MLAEVNPVAGDIDNRIQEFREEKREMTLGGSSDPGHCCNYIQQHQKDVRTQFLLLSCFHVGVAFESSASG